jgi:hypothetical protein
MKNTCQPSHGQKVDVHADLFLFEVDPPKKEKIVDLALRAAQTHVWGMRRA